MIRIGFIYIDAANLGDLVIKDTALHILKEILNDHVPGEYEIIPIGIGSFRAKMSGIEISDEDKRKARKLIRKARALPINEDSIPEISTLLLRAWKLKSKLYRFFEKYEKMKLNSCDIFIFDGGGLIKFRKQYFHFFIELITRFAEKKKLPVFLNAVGVEGFDEGSRECMMLKAALNRSSVKYISTRDDFETLSGSYVTNAGTIIKDVCDPALFVPETYGIKADAGSALIGLNTIRPNIFEEYGDGIDETFILDEYVKLIEMLRNTGREVQLFTNGLKADNEFADRINERLSGPKVSVKKPACPKELVETISSFERIMAVRLHAAIIGTSFGIPNVSLVWNQKQTMFGEKLGLPQNFISSKDFSAELMFERLMNAKPVEVTDALKNAVKTCLEEALSPFLITPNTQQQSSDS